MLARSMGMVHLAGLRGLRALLSSLDGLPNAVGIDGFDSASPGMKANLRTMRFMVRAREPRSYAAITSLSSPEKGVSSKSGTFGTMGVSTEVSGPITGPRARSLRDKNLFCLMNFCCSPPHVRMSGTGTFTWRDGRKCSNRFLHMCCTKKIQTDGSHGSCIHLLIY